MPSNGVSTERKYQQSRAVQTLLLATATTLTLISTKQVVDTGSATITVAAVTLGVIEIRGEYTRLPVGEECSDRNSEPRDLSTRSCDTKCDFRKREEQSNSIAGSSWLKC